MRPLSRTSLFLSLLFFAASLLVATGCEPQAEQEAAPADPEPAVAADDFELTGDAAAGQQIYAAQCASCHGSEGRGDGPAGAALNPPASDLTATELSPAEIYKVTDEGGPALGLSPLMAPFGNALSEEQLQDVTAYVVSLSN